MFVEWEVGPRQKLDVAPDGKCFWHSLVAYTAPTLKEERGEAEKWYRPVCTWLEEAKQKILADEVQKGAHLIEMGDLFLITRILDIAIAVSVDSALSDHVPKELHQSLHLPDVHAWDRLKESAVLLWFGYSVDGANQRHGHWCPLVPTEDSGNSPVCLSPRFQVCCTYEDYANFDVTLAQLWPQGVSPPGAETDGIWEEAAEAWVDRFSFAKRLVAIVLDRAKSNPVLQDSLLFKSITSSSFFSGIGVSEVAGTLLENAFGSTGFTSATKYACDKGQACQTHLLQLSKDRHIFKDILHLLEPEILHEIHEVEKTNKQPWAWFRVLLAAWAWILDGSVWA